MKGINSFVINFILPIVILFFVFRINLLAGIIVLLLFVGYALVKSRGEVFANIGNIQYMKGKEDSAYFWIGKATKSKYCKPNFVIAYAFLKLKRGEVDEAERLLQKVIDSNASKDDKNKAKTTMSLVNWRKGRLYFAINNLEALYEEYKNTTLYGYLGFLYIAKGDLERALTFNEEAYEYNSTNQIIVNNLAHTNFLLGNFEKAENLYKELMEKTPNFSEAYYYYALTKLSRGYNEDVIDLLKKSLEYKCSALTLISEEEVKAKIKEVEAGRK